MMMISYWALWLVLLWLVDSGRCIPSLQYGKQLKYEEYIIEHEISSGQAKNSILAIDLNSILPSPGCPTCTSKDKRYCLGIDLINDHCCCDKRYHEIFPFIPHTCYKGNQLCKPVASNCEEYFRLSTCCCKKYAFLKWKEKNSGAKATVYMTFLSILAYIIYNLL